MSYGLQRLDHAVGNVPDLAEAVNYISRMSGFHDFAEFTAEVSPTAACPLLLCPMINPYYAGRAS